MSKNKIVSSLLVVLLAGGLVSGCSQTDKPTTAKDAMTSQNGAKGVSLPEQSKDVKQKISDLDNGKVEIKQVSVNSSDTYPEVEAFYNTVKYDDAGIKKKAGNKDIRLPRFGIQYSGLSGEEEKDLAATVTPIFTKAKEHARNNFNLVKTLLTESDFSTTGKLNRCSKVFQTLSEFSAEQNWTAKTSKFIADLACKIPGQNADKETPIVDEKLYGSLANLIPLTTGGQLTDKDKNGKPQIHVTINDYKNQGSNKGELDTLDKIIPFKPLSKIKDEDIVYGGQSWAFHKLSKPEDKVNVYRIEIPITVKNYYKEDGQNYVLEFSQHYIVEDDGSGKMKFSPDVRGVYPLLFETK